MRLIDRYICRQVFSHALLGLGIFSFVFFVPQLVRLMDLVVRHPGSWTTIASLFLSTLPGVLVFTLPIAVLVGVLEHPGVQPVVDAITERQVLGLLRPCCVAVERDGDICGDGGHAESDRCRPRKSSNRLCSVSVRGIVD